MEISGKSYELVLGMSVTEVSGASSVTTTSCIGVLGKDLMTINRMISYTLNCVGATRC